MFNMRLKWCFQKQKVQLKTIINCNMNKAVIFVHGLFGDPYRTWKGLSNEVSLPEMIRDDPALYELDVYSFGYKSNLHWLQYDFFDVASILHSEIDARLANHDIFFITHSMGGLIVQQYIVDQLEKGNLHIINRIKGIAYLSVPFEGSIYGNMFAKLHKQVNTLKAFSKDLADLKQKWIRYFYPNQHIPQLLLYGAKDQIVSRYSAKPTHINGTIYDVDEDHLSITRVDSNSTVYLHLRQFLIDHFMKVSEPTNKIKWDQYQKMFSEDANINLI